VSEITRVFFPGEFLFVDRKFDGVADIMCFHLY
jgi:hypothetical protein